MFHTSFSHGFPYDFSHFPIAKFPTPPGDGSDGSSLATVLGALGAGAGGGAPVAGATLVLHLFKAINGDEWGVPYGNTYIHNVYIYIYVCVMLVPMTIHVLYYIHSIYYIYTLIFR